MEIIGSILYGFVSGLTEILPVSAQANQYLMRQLLGVSQKEPIRDMLIHIAVLAAVLFACRSLFLRLRRDQAFQARMRKSRTKAELPRGIYEMRLVRSALPVLVIGLFCSFFLPNLTENRIVFSLLCVVNGIILMVPSHMHQGNKSPKAMTALDGFFLGLAGALSIFPGISRLGSIVSMSILRKADRTSGFSWALMLSIPAMLVWAIVDFISIFTIGVGSIALMTVVGYLISAVFAFAGTYLAITILKILIERTQLSAFAYYSFGIALLSFLLYLIT